MHFQPPATTTMFAGNPSQISLVHHHGRSAAADFSLNAIAISLNPASRGLLLDPTIGASPISNAPKCVRFHSQLHQPVRSACCAFCATPPSWASNRAAHSGMFDLAIERQSVRRPSRRKTLAKNSRVAREERPAVVLKSVGEHDLLRPSIPCWPKNILLMTPLST